MFGDFFIEDFLAHFFYTGIYRYHRLLPHPALIPCTKVPQLPRESDEWHGIVWTRVTLLSGSKAILHWWFLSYVAGYIRSHFLLPFSTPPLILILSLPTERTNE